MKNIKLKIICFSTIVSCCSLVSTPLIAHADTINAKGTSKPIESSNYNSLSTSKNNESNYSSSFVKKLTPYITVKDGQYSINPDIYKNKDISKNEISSLKKVLAKSNETIKKFEIKNLNIYQGNKIEIKNTMLNNRSEQSFAQINGYNGFRAYWWGCVISLNSENSTALINAAIDGDSAAMGAAIGFCIGDLPGAVAGGLVGGALGGAMSVYGDNSPEAIYGCNIQINYFTAPLVQSVWVE